MEMKTAAQNVMNTLNEAGYEAYLVGGCVRDLMLGRTPKDYDVCTNARPEQVQTLFLKTTPVGASFGVVVVVEGGHQIEVATYRADGQYTDGRRPDAVRYSDTPKEDVVRRDFTINGMLMCKAASTPTELDETLRTRVVDGAAVMDYSGGLHDLENRVIRCIGDPVARFTEDSLRMLRAVRFVAELGFEVEENTKKAIMQLGSTITRVSRERVAQEMVKLLMAPYAVRGLAMLYSTGLARHLFPNVDFATVNVAVQMERFECFRPTDANEALAMFLTDMSAAAILSVLKSLKLSNDRYTEVFGAVVSKMGAYDGFHNVYTAAELKRFARKPGAALAVKLAEQDEHMGLRVGSLGLNGLAMMFGSRFDVLTPEEIYPTPLVTGADLIAMGLTPGPRFKGILDHVEALQLNGVFTDRERALNYVRELEMV